MFNLKLNAMVKITSDFQFNELKSKKIDILTSSETSSFLKNNPFVIEPDYLSIDESIRLFGIGKKPEPFQSEELPESFKNRTFIKNLSSLTYKLEELPGHIIKYDAEKNDYVIVSIRRFVEENKSPEATIIDDGILYSAKINSGASFNGSFLIGGLKVDSKSIMELIIQDVIMSIIPDALILKDVIEKVAENIPASERKNYFFIKGTTLTIINNRKYKEQKFEAKVNNTYVTAGGKVFASNEKFSRERLVSLDLVSLDDILKVKA